MIIEIFRHIKLGIIVSKHTWKANEKVNEEINLLINSTWHWQKRYKR